MSEHKVEDAIITIELSSSSEDETQVQNQEIIEELSEYDIEDSEDAVQLSSSNEDEIKVHNQFKIQQIDNSERKDPEVEKGFKIIENLFSFMANNFFSLWNHLVSFVSKMFSQK